MWQYCWNGCAGGLKHPFSSGLRLMAIIRIHLMIYFLECNRARYTWIGIRPFLMKGCDVNEKCSLSGTYSFINMAPHVCSLYMAMTTVALMCNLENKNIKKCIRVKPSVPRRWLPFWIRISFMKLQDLFFFFQMALYIKATINDWYNSCLFATCIFLEAVRT